MPVLPEEFDQRLGQLRGTEGPGPQPAKAAVFTRDIEARPRFPMVHDVASGSMEFRPSLIKKILGLAPELGDLGSFLRPVPPKKVRAGAKEQKFVHKSQYNHFSGSRLIR